MPDNRFAVLTLPYTNKDLARPRELLVDYLKGRLYVKSEDGLSEILIGDGTNGKLVMIEEHGDFESDSTSLTINQVGFNISDPDNRVLVYIGGIFKTLNKDYEITSSNTITSLEGDWRRGWSYDIILIRNIYRINNDDVYDVSRIPEDSIMDFQLSNVEGQLKSKVDNHLSDTSVHISSDDKLKLDSINLIDRTTGEKYNLYINNGSLNIELEV